jgi:NADPH-dependent 2,4-dienoyl-CoA reductase/sulfur reductase-like enzyme
MVFIALIYHKQHGISSLSAGTLLLKNHRIVVVGGNIAGLNAAMCARGVNKKAELTILSREPYHPYRRSMLSSIIALGGSSPEEISMCMSQLDKLRIRYLRNVDVKNLHLDDRTVAVQNVKTKEKSVFAYDKIVLATGGFSAIPSIRGVEKKGAFCLRFFEDALQILKSVRPGCNAVVVGGGFAGLEIAEALAKRGARVWIVVRSRILREFVEPNLSGYVKSRIEQKGVKVMTGVSPAEIGGEKSVKYVRLEDGTKILASVVAFVTGVNPNVELARKAGIELGATGALKVDQHMQTSNSGIYAAGDCAEALDAISGIWTYYPVGSVAAKEGAIAGRNAAGDKAEFGGVIRAQIDVVFGEGIASIGHGSESAKGMGMKVDLVDLSLMKNRFKFLLNCPAKLVVAVDADGRMVGAQVISSRFASQYACTLFWAIEKRMTLDDFLGGWQPTISAYTRGARN